MGQEERFPDELGSMYVNVRWPKGLSVRRVVNFIENLQQVLTRRQEMTSSRRFRINRYARRYRRTRPSSCAYSDALASSGHRAADANAPAVRKR